MSLSSCDVLQVLVKAGDKVAVGDPLMVMIAMKMEVRRCARRTHFVFQFVSNCSTKGTNILSFRK